MTPQEQASYIRLGQAAEAFLAAWWEMHMGISPTEQALVEEHGEVVDYSQAMAMLGKSAPTISTMCKDGRLQGGGGVVYTRSIAKYMDAGRPSAQRNRAARGEQARLKAASGATFERIRP